MSFTTFQALDISTSHISEDTNNILTMVAKTNDFHFTVAEYEYGYFVGVPNVDNDPDFKYQDEVPEDLRKVLDFARKNKCLIVRLDADADQCDDLPTFNW